MRLGIELLFSVGGGLFRGTGGWHFSWMADLAGVPNRQIVKPLAWLPSCSQVRPTKTSKAFWEAMSKVQNHLTDAKKIAAYNQKKEQKMRVSRLG